MDSKPLPGRKAEAARNDAAILEAARAVFMRDPSASMADVAHEAGVGVGGLYRRYANKDALLQKICGDGLREFADLADAAMADKGDAGEALADFVRGVVEADMHSLTVRLAGTFRTTDELRELATTSSATVDKVLRRAVRAGAVRKDLSANDLPMIFEQLAAVRLPDAKRTQALRRRYLTLHLDALLGQVTPLPERPPTGPELGQRWQGPGHA